MVFLLISCNGDDDGDDDGDCNLREMREQKEKQTDPQQKCVVVMLWYGAVSGVHLASYQEVWSTLLEQS